MMLGELFEGKLESGLSHYNKLIDNERNLWQGEKQNNP